MSLIVFQQNTGTATNRRVFFPAYQTDGVTPYTTLTGHAEVLKGGLTSFIQYAITGATQANPVNVTAVGCATLLKSGDTVFIMNVVGMTQINGWWVVGTVTTDHFTLLHLDGTTTVDGTAFTAYSSAGTVDQYIRQSGNSIQQIGNNYYTLDLSLPGFLDPTDAGETDAFGRGKVRIARSSMLTIEEEYQVVNYDPDAAGVNASDIVSALLAQTTHGVTVEQLLHAAGAMDFSISGNTLTLNYADGTSTSITRTIGRSGSALNAITSAA